MGGSVLVSNSGSILVSVKAQRDLGIAFSVIRNATKDVLNRAQQGIGTEMFSHFGNDEAHGNPQQKIDPFTS